MEKRRLKNRPSGSRQKIWDQLRGAEKPLKPEQIADRAGAQKSTVRSYIHGLKAHGYVVQNADGAYKLIRNTGPIAPALNHTTKTLDDKNLNPPMPPEELKKIYEDFGGSLNKFADALGLGLGNGTRIRQMMTGQRLITVAVEKGADKLRKEKSNNIAD